MPPTLDNFTKALQDNHMIPLTFTATDLAWSDENPGNVVATVNATGPDPEAGGLSFPMEFAPRPGRLGAVPADRRHAAGVRRQPRSADAPALAPAHAASTPTSTPTPTPTR